jgi:hypothetical protein
MLDCVRHTAYLLLFVTAAALVLSIAYLMLARIFTRALMHITLVLSIILNMQARSNTSDRVLC